MTELDLSGVILAGGRSQRLGQEKALLRLWGPQGPTLLEATVARVAAVCAEVLVVTDTPRSWPLLPARVVFDRYPGAGALGGLYSGLAEATSPYILAVACDMPFLSEALLRSMAGRPRDYDVLIPRLHAQDRHRSGSASWVEPLHAIYGRPCLAPMQEDLDRGERQIIHFFPRVRVRYLEQDEWMRFDPAGLAFRNINTPQDLEEARRILGL